MSTAQSELPNGRHSKYPGGTVKTLVAPPKPVLPEVDDELTRAWVRTKLGQNRGEDRVIHGTTGPFDALLDQRLAVSPAVPLDKDY